MDKSASHGKNGKTRATGVITPIFAFALGVFLIFMGVVDRQSNRHDAQTLTASAVATVQGEPHERSERDCGGSRKHCETTYYCSFTYVFAAGGGADSGDGDGVRGEGEDRDRCGDQQANGAQRTVYFNPDDPAQSTVSNPNTGLNKHGWLISFIIGIVSLAVGFGSIWFNRWLAKPSPAQAGKGTAGAGDAPSDGGLSGRDRPEGRRSDGDGPSGERS